MGRLLHQLKTLLRILEVKPAKVSMSEIRPPDVVRGMKQLDREMFAKVVILPSIVTDPCNIPKIVPAVKNHLFKMVKLKGVVDLEGTDKKIVLLNPDKINSFTDLPEKSRSILEELGINSLTFENVKLSYENFAADEVLKAVLPEDKETCASHSIIGHIIQINLRDHLLDYEKLIGDVLLDKVTRAKTVVCKTDAIDNTFRTFKIKVVCGEDNMIASVRENGCQFDLDFANVYWNPRLATEHQRIVDGLKKNSVLYDVFAGIGPFSVLAAKKGCTVVANDLNPHSFKWLNHNVKLNKVTQKVTTFNKDGAEFLQTDVKNHLLQLWKSDKNVDVHIAMNLPAMAVTFLKHLRSLLPEELKGTNENPTVHVYCFTKNAADPKTSAVSMVESELEVELGSRLKNVHHVRTVSNMKEMMAVTFSIPSEVLFAPESDEPPAKKICLSE